LKGFLKHYCKYTEYYSLIGATAVIFCTYSNIMAYIHNWIKVKLNIKYEDFLKLEGEIKFNMNVSFVYQEPGRQSR